MTDWQQAGTNAFAEKDITYDANGNILTMRRYGADASLESDYSYAYSGNRLMGLTDKYSSVPFPVNELNLPDSAEVSGALVRYLYLADGTKLAALRDGTGYIYCGSMVYSGKDRKCSVPFLISGKHSFD